MLSAAAPCARRLASADSALAIALAWPAAPRMMLLAPGFDGSENNMFNSRADISHQPRRIRRRNTEHLDDSARPALQGVPSCRRKAFHRRTAPSVRKTLYKSSQISMCASAAEVQRMSNLSKTRAPQRRFASQTRARTQILYAIPRTIEMRRKSRHTRSTRHASATRGSPGDDGRGRQARQARSRWRPQLRGDPVDLHIEAP